MDNETEFVDGLRAQLPANVLVIATGEGIALVIAKRCLEFLAQCPPLQDHTGNQQQLLQEIEDLLKKVKAKQQ
jgi:hypothetical protein